LHRLSLQKQASTSTLNKKNQTSRNGINPRPSL
jgi:hypothetical protein